MLSRRVCKAVDPAYNTAKAFSPCKEARPTHVFGVVLTLVCRRAKAAKAWHPPRHSVALSFFRYGPYRKDSGRLRRHRDQPGAHNGARGQLGVFSARDRLRRSVLRLAALGAVFFRL